MFTQRINPCLILISGSYTCKNSLSFSLASLFFCLISWYTSASNRINNFIFTSLSTICHLSSPWFSIPRSTDSCDVSSCSPYECMTDIIVWLSSKKLYEILVSLISMSHSSKNAILVKKLRTSNHSVIFNFIFKLLNWSFLNFNQILYIFQTINLFVINCYKIPSFAW